MALAQAETIGKIVTKSMDSAENYGFVGVLLMLTILAIMFALYMFGKFLGRRDELERVSREKYAEDDRKSRQLSEESFLRELKEQRDIYDKQLSEQRKQGLELGRSGQMSVTALSEAFHELAMAISMESGSLPLTQSGILKRRESRKKKESDSVLE